MSPALVVAFALAGTVRIDLTRDPIGIDREGRTVMLMELWPSSAELSQAVEVAPTPERFRCRYAGVFDGDAQVTGRVFRYSASPKR
jgi:aconitate hydratase